jgi:hypothetical protein
VLKPGLLGQLILATVATHAARNSFITGVLGRVIYSFISSGSGAGAGSGLTGGASSTTTGGCVGTSTGAGDCCEVLFLETEQPLVIKSDKIIRCRDLNLSDITGSFKIGLLK